MKKDATEKKTRQGLSLSPELLAAAKQKGGANLSAYIRGLIERDLAGKSTTPDVLSPTVIEDLTQDLLGKLDACTMAKGLAHPSQYKTQPVLLKAILYGLIEFFENGGRFTGQDEDDIRPRVTSELFERSMRVHLENLRATAATTAAPSGPPPIETVRIQTDPGILAGRSTHGRTGRKILMEKEGKAAG